MCADPGAKTPTAGAEFSIVFSRFFLFFYLLSVKVGGFVKFALQTFLSYLYICISICVFIYEHLFVGFQFSNSKEMFIKCLAWLSISYSCICSVKKGNNW